MPHQIQAQIRPYLDQPHQLALTILDCCDANHPLAVAEITQHAGVKRETARQVLQALKTGGMSFALSHSRSWQPTDVQQLMADVYLAMPDRSETEFLTAPQYTASSEP